MEPKLKPIILDRSRLEQYSVCPRQGYLMTLWDGLKAGSEGMETFEWEKSRLDSADMELLGRMQKVILQSTDGKFAECGTEIHDLIDKAFQACNNDLDLIPDWFVKNLPKIKPNIQPMAIRHARHIGDMLANYHVDIISVEQQVDLIIVPETKAIPAIKRVAAPAIIATTRIDLLGSGKDNLHVVDWKTGYKSRSNTEALEAFQTQCIALLLFNQKKYKDVETIHFWYYETRKGDTPYARFDRNEVHPILNKNEENPRLPGLTTEVALMGRVTSAVKLFMDDRRDARPLPEACAWCDVIRFCPQASMEAKEIADDPKAFIDNLVVLDAICKRMKKAATTWIKAKGPIEGTKVQWGRNVPQNKFTAGFQDKAIGNLTKLDNTELNSHFE